MKITKTLIEPNIPDEAYYSVNVKTMTGDASDWHEVELVCDNEQELRDAIVAVKILLNCFPNGMGGCDSYVGHYWEKYFEENIHYSEECDHVDSIDSIDSIVYHDTDGSKYSVNVELDDEMKEEIIHPKLDKDELDEMRYPPKNRIKF